MSDPDFYEKVGTAAKQNKAGQTPGLRVAFDDPSSNGDPAAVKKYVRVGDGARRWSQTEGGAYFGTLNTVELIPPGMYSCGFSNTVGFFLNEMKLETDGLLDLPDSATAKIVAEFEQFWKLAPDFKSRGFLLKRGYLLWGPPASGKSTAVYIMIRKLINEHGGIVVISNDHPNLTTGCLAMVRKIEPERPIIVVLEDIDALIEKHGEQHFLALLDGESQINSVVFVASTNYPERLDKRFVDRPSRFDTIQYVGMPSAAARKAYLMAKEPSLTGDELKQWVKLSHGFSVAHLKEMIIAVRCFKQPLADVVERLEKMQARKPTSEDAPDRTGMGLLPPHNGNGHDLGDDWESEDLPA